MMSSLAKILMDEWVFSENQKLVFCTFSWKIVIRFLAWGFDGLQVNEVFFCCTTTLQVWYFANLMIFLNILWDVHLLLLLTLISKKIKIFPSMTCNIGTKVAVLHSPLNEGLALIVPFFTYQFYLRERLKSFSMSRNI